MDLDATPEDFHAHVYFTLDTRNSAMELRRRLAESDTVIVDLQPMRDGPIGPHPTSMFNAHISKQHFGVVMHWLMLNHGPHSILIHPMTPDPVMDHSQHALWLGERLDLRLENL